MPTESSRVCVTRGHGRSQRPWAIAAHTAAIFVVLCCLSIPRLTAQGLLGQVERVIDGDTLVVGGIGTVRLIGVDAPETVDPRRPVQYFGAEASGYTNSVARGQLVRLELEGREKDLFKRTLAYVYLPGGRMLNEELIRKGYGHAYTAYPFSRMEAFRALELDARKNNRGLWGNTGAAVPVHAFLEQPAAATVATTVYVTRTGGKYHRAGCRSLARSQMAMTLKDAAGRYGPCGVCHPPTLLAVASTVPGAPERVTSAPQFAATSSRCQATTKKGTQCLRNAQPGRAYCWQH